MTEITLPFDLVTLAQPRPYEVGSYHVLREWALAENGAFISGRQAGFITASPQFNARLYRQFVTLPNDETIFLQTALRAAAPLLYKVYYNVIGFDGVSAVCDTVDRRLDGHHANSSNLGAYPWWTIGSIAPC